MECIPQPIQSNNMKVIYLIHTTELHGSTLSFLNLILHLKNKTEIIVVFEKKKRNEFKEILLKNNIKFHEVTRVPLSYIPNKNIIHDLIFIIKNLIYKCIFYIELLNLVLKEKPDIIHTNTGVIYEGYNVAKFLGIPHVWHIREYQDKDFKWKFLYGKKHFEKRLHNSYVITITNDLKNHFHLSTNATTIYNGILSTKDIRIRTKSKYFLCASRIVSYKKQEDAIKAFSLFYKKNPDWKLIIAGEREKDGYYDYLVKLCTSLGCQNGVDFIGKQSQTSIYDFMSEASALIVPSLNEGFGRMTAEACFCGTLILGRDSGGTKEILEQIDGFKFSDISQLYESMLHIKKIINTNIYNEKIIRSQEYAIKNFSIEQNCEKTYDLYKHITNKYGYNNIAVPRL